MQYLATHRLGRHFFATNLHENDGWTSQSITEAGEVENSLFSRRYIHPDEQSSRTRNNPFEQELGTPPKSIQLSIYNK